MIKIFNDREFHRQIISEQFAILSINFPYPPIHLFLFWYLTHAHKVGWYKKTWQPTYVNEFDLDTKKDTKLGIVKEKSGGGYGYDDDYRSDGYGGGLNFHNNSKSWTEYFFLWWTLYTFNWKSQIFTISKSQIRKLCYKFCISGFASQNFTGLPSLYFKIKSKSHSM